MTVTYRERREALVGLLEHLREQKTLEGGVVPEYSIEDEPRAAKMDWVKLPADKLTVGLRDACKYGLAIALPVGPDVLGWAMEGREP